MKTQKSHLGFMLGFIFQLMAMLLFYFIGITLSGLGILMLGALITVIAMTETPKINRLHAFGLMLTIIGLIVTAVFVLFEIYSKISILMILTYTFAFFLFSFKFPVIIRKRIPKTLPRTNMEKLEKIKVGEEAEKIFAEIEKLEQEIKKQKEKTKEIKIKTNQRKKASKTVTKKYSSVKNGKTFHLPSCTILLRQDPKNYVYYSSRAQALARGNRPCRVCNP